MQTDKPRTASPQPVHRFPSRQFLLVAGMLLVVAVAHVRSLGTDFFLDDFFNLKNALDAGWSWRDPSSNFVISDEKTIGSKLPAFGDFEVRYFRPGFLASLKINEALSGLRPFGYMLTNLLLHVSVVLAFYGILRELLPDNRVEAIAGATLYGVMPNHGMAVGWLSGRTELLPGLAMMAGLWAWLRFARNGRWPDYVLSLAAFAVALPCKENAVTFPLIVAAAWWLVARRPRPVVWLLAPYFVLVGLYFIIRQNALGGFPLPPPSFYYHSPSEPNFAWWAVAKATCLFWSILTHLPIQYPTELRLSQHHGATVLLFVVTCIAGLLLMRFLHGRKADRERRLAWFSVIWIFAGLLPTAPLFIVPFYFYFPLGGVVLLYLVLWRRLVRFDWRERVLRIRWRRAVPVALLVLYVAGLQIPITLLRYLSKQNDRINHELFEVIDSPEDGQRIFLIDAHPLAANLKPASELHWPDRNFRVSILTLAPYIFLPDRISTIDRIDTNRLAAEAVGVPYFAGPLGIIAVGDRPPFALHEGMTWGTKEVRAEALDVERRGPLNIPCVRRFVFTFAKPVDSPDYLFIRYAGEKPQRWRPPEFSPGVRAAANDQRESDPSPPTVD